MAKFIEITVIYIGRTGDEDGVLESEEEAFFAAWDREHPGVTVPRWGGSSDTGFDISLESEDGDLALAAAKLLVKTLGRGKLAPEGYEFGNVSTY